MKISEKSRAWISRGIRLAQPHLSAPFLHACFLLIRQGNSTIFHKREKQRNKRRNQWRHMHISRNRKNTGNRARQNCQEAHRNFGTAICSQKVGSSVKKLESFRHRISSHRGGGWEKNVHVHFSLIQNARALGLEKKTSLIALVYSFELDVNASC